MVTTPPHSFRVLRHCGYFSVRQLDDGVQAELSYLISMSVHAGIAESNSHLISWQCACKCALLIPQPSQPAKAPGVPSPSHFSELTHFIKFLSFSVKREFSLWSTLTLVRHILFTAVVVVIVQPECALSIRATLFVWPDPYRRVAHTLSLSSPIQPVLIFAHLYHHTSLLYLGSSCILPTLFLSLFSPSLLHFILQY